MSKYNSVTLVGSASNTFKAGFVGIEKTLDLYVRGIDMLHTECDIIERRQSLRIEDINYELTEQAAKNAAKRKKLSAWFIPYTSV